MTDREILRHIDEGANFYVSLFGDAAHMEKVHKEFYSYVKPRAGEQGVSFLYDVRIENLPVEQRKTVIEEMKAMHMPIWLNLCSSDETFFLFSGAKRAHGQTEIQDNEEVYMAILPEEKRGCPENAHEIIKVRSAEEFAQWAGVANDILAGGRPDMHPANHFALCEKGLMECYILYHDGIPVSVAAIVDNKGVASLEFVATIPEMRRKGFAGAVCGRAVGDAFSDGASIITVRAVDAAVAKVYQSIGFRAYNAAI